MKNLEGKNIEFKYKNTEEWYSYIYLDDKEYDISYVQESDFANVTHVQISTLLDVRASEFNNVNEMLIKIKRNYEKVSALHARHGLKGLELLEDFLKNQSLDDLSRDVEIHDYIDKIVENKIKNISDRFGGDININKLDYKKYIANATANWLYVKKGVYFENRSITSFIREIKEFFPWAMILTKNKEDGKIIISDAITYSVYDIHGTWVFPGRNKTLEINSFFGIGYKELFKVVPTDEIIDLTSVISYFNL